MEEKPKKIFTQQQALKKASDYCAIQERCQQEVRDKLYYWGLHHDDVEATIANLISEGFINEERFAKAFAGGKFRIKKWGRVKIINELKLRKITKYCINKALEEIDDKEYLRSLDHIIEKKTKEIKEKNKYSKIKKVVTYAVSRGYENEIVWELIKEKFEI